jgi:HlyD family secretion protein
VAVLDTAELMDRVANARTRLASSETQIPQLEISIRLQRESTQSDIRRAEAAMQSARAQLEELRNGSRPQEVEQARQAVTATRSRLTNAELELARAKELYATGAIPKKALDNAQMAADMAAADQKKAAEFLAMVQEGARKETIAAAEARLRQAEAQLEQAKLGKLMVARLEQQLQTAQAEVEFARSQLKLSQTQLGYAQLVSTVSGRVISKNAEVGEIVSLGAPVITLADLEDIWLRVFIDATDLGKIKLGQAVKVSTDSYPGKTYEGTISFISSEAEFTPKTIQTQKERVKLVYRLKVQIKNVNQELKPGMPADAVIPL